MARVASKPEMHGVSFVPFPKYKTCPEKCQRWIRACCREGFEVASISRNTYMCSKHFVGGNGPTKDHPVGGNGPTKDHPVGGNGPTKDHPDLY